MTTVDIGRLPRGQDGQLVIGNTGKSPLWKTVSGDATLAASGALTLSAAFQALLTPTAPAAFSVHKNGSNQTGVADITDTTVTWSTEVYDVGSYFASNGWTPPSGKVSLHCHIQASGSISADTFFKVSIVKNGNIFKRGISFSPTASVASGSVTVEDVANGSDVYTVKVYVDVTAGTATLDGDSTLTYFMGHWISA